MVVDIAADIPEVILDDVSQIEGEERMRSADLDAAYEQS